MRFNPPIYLSMFLLLSAIIEGIILTTDYYIWYYAPSHAYATLVFIVVDIALIVSLLKRKNLGLRLTTLWGAIKFLLMAADPLTASSFGFGISEFTAYLFGLWTFDLLLGLQVLIIAAGATAMKRGVAGKTN